MKEKAWKVILPAAFWLLVWEGAALLVGRELLLPSPWTVGRTLWGLLGEGAFWRSILFSLVRITLGFLLGTVLGMVLGGLTARWRWCDALFSPALRAVRTVPVVSFILLLFFWLPTGKVPSVVAALMVLPVVWRSTRQGVNAADPLLLEAARAYRLGTWRTFRLVYLPAALPALSAGWETGLGLAWKSGVAAEVLCSPKWAAGTMLQTSKAYLDSPGLFAWTIVIVAVSLGMEGLLKGALRSWRGGEGT